MGHAFQVINPLSGKFKCLNSWERNKWWRRLKLEWRRWKKQLANGKLSRAVSWEPNWDKFVNTYYYFVAKLKWKWINFNSVHCEFFECVCILMSRLPWWYAWTLNTWNKYQMSFISQLFYSFLFSRNLNKDLNMISTNINCLATGDSFPF